MANGIEGDPLSINGTVNGIPKLDPATIGTGADSGNGGHSADAGTAAASSGQPKRRGRPRGSKNRAAEASGKTPQVAVDVDAVSAILFSLHTMLAGITKTPECAIDEREAKAIAEATEKVANLYDLSASAKTVAWTNLAMALGMIYGPRIIAVSMRKKNERKTRSEKVTPIRGADFTSPNGKLPPFDIPPTRQ